MPSFKGKQRLEVVAKSNSLTFLLTFELSLLEETCMTMDRACFEIPARFKTGQNLKNYLANKRMLIRT